MAKMRVSKIDAARRQIETAIVLLFDNGDPVSIHTLAAAGGRILRDLCEQNTPMHQAFKNMIVPGKENMYREVINRAANFFKHADSDADEILDDVREEANDSLLILACSHYTDLAFTPTPAMHAFMRWMFSLYPEMLHDTDPSKRAFTSKEVDWLRAAPRTEQLAWGKALLTGKLPA